MAELVIQHQYQKRPGLAATFLNSYTTTMSNVEHGGGVRQKCIHEANYEVQGIHLLSLFTVVLGQQNTHQILQE